ncbi:MAG: hypothetical protein QOH21_3346 [Acidobacteriota bacterium]|nr:hypothetical protein [Acidobacteriota bacterium]
MHGLRCAVLLLSLSILPAAAQDRFESAAAGLSLSKPTGWAFVASGTKADVTNEDLQKAFEQQQTLPLVAMTNPQALFSNFQVTLIPRNQSLATASPRQILELIVLPSVQKRFPELKLEVPVRELEISGHSAAKYVATNTIRRGELAMPLRTQAILIARSKFFYLIDFTAAADDDQATRDFEKIVSSITIDPDATPNGR